MRPAASLLQESVVCPLRLGFGEFTTGGLSALGYICLAMTTTSQAEVDMGCVPSLSASSPILSLFHVKVCIREWFGNWYIK